MNDLIKMLAVAGTAIALSVSLPGCGESSESKSAETHSADDGHDHAGDGDDTASTTIMTTARCGRLAA